MKKPAFFFLATTVATFCAADEPPATTPPTDDATTLDTVTVTGEQPGPGLWKVSKGDHVLWILGVQYPLPKNMSWHAKEVDETIAQSQEVIADASPKLEVSFLHKLTLLPSVYSARKNENGATLKDVLPPDVYARWETLKTKYMGNDSSVEHLRPLVAANELYDKALSRTGLARNGLIWQSVRDTAKKNHVKVVDTEVSIPVDDPGQTIRDFKSTSGSTADVECLSATMTRIETDMDAMRQRANAWAVGDVPALKSLPAPSQQTACLSTIASNSRLHQQLDAAMVQIQTAWLAAAEKGLDENASTFAVLPMDELLRPDRRLAKLRDKGYTIEEPE